MSAQATLRAQADRGDLFQWAALVASFLGMTEPGYKGSPIAIIAPVLRLKIVLNQLSDRRQRRR